jgi:hypothetical protein
VAFYRRGTLMLKHLIIILTFLMTLPINPAFADSDDDLAKWERFISLNPYGDEDVYLQMNTSYGWSTVAVIMGYWDDWVACNEIKQGLKLTGNLRDYRCVPAN